jgi:two-component system invasion response regulator UvrY
MKILLLEDHPIVRLGLVQVILGRWPDSEILEMETARDALAQVRQTAFDIVVTDLNLPDTKGLESLGLLLRAAPSAKVLVLSLNDEAAYAARALQMGAYGYLEKSRASKELISALETIQSGQRYLTASQADRLARQMAGEVSVRSHEKLTDQEHRVMLLLAEGVRVTEIGERMNLSPKTVTTYRTRVLEKLGLSSNSDLLRYCLEHGLLQ